MGTTNLLLRHHETSTPKKNQGLDTSHKPQSQSSLSGSKAIHWKNESIRIWSYRGILFSIQGNTPETVTHLIHNSVCGLSTKQLEQITSVKCLGIRLKLLKEGKITRIKEGFDYIYLSSKPKVKRAQSENRGLISQELLVEAQTSRLPEKPKEIHNLLELGEGDYLLRRLEIVRRVKSEKSQAQVARELDCSPDTVRNTCKTFEKNGAKGLVITPKKRPFKMTENMEKKIHLAQLNDINGNFILFKLVPSTTEFADILIELIERMKRVLNITTLLILVVDREAEALPALSGTQPTQDLLHCC